MSKLVRKNIFMSRQIAEWYEEQSELTGMSQSNLMVMALHGFMTEQKAFKMMDQYSNLQNRLDGIQESIEENPQK